MLSGAILSSWALAFLLAFYTLDMITQKVVGECSRNFWEDRSSDKEHLIPFWDLSGSGSRINFLALPSLRDRVFTH